MRLSTHTDREVSRNRSFKPHNKCVHVCLGCSLVIVKSEMSLKDGFVCSLFEKFSFTIRMRYSSHKLYSVEGISKIFVMIRLIVSGVDQNLKGVRLLSPNSPLKLSFQFVCFLFLSFIFAYFFLAECSRSAIGWTIARF